MKNPHAQALNTLTSSRHNDIRAAITFYESKGWDWISVVCYFAMRADGRWPMPVIRTRIGTGYGRPRGKQTK